MDGDSLEAALRDYGPAAIEDLLPRLRTIAETLDQAHAAGQLHGSLHPQNIVVSAERTEVTGLGELDLATPVRLPYTAPEVAAGGPARPASDQFALAAIAYEWLFGRRISGPAARAVEVRTLPSVDRDAMSQAFTRALAPDADHRFRSCLAFYQALRASLIPTLPLGRADDDDLLVGVPMVAAPEIAVEHEAQFEPDLEPESEPDLHLPEARFEVIEPPPPLEPVTTWQPSAAYTPPRAVERFGGGMLIAALLVGMVVGFAAGYMARPRALQSGPIQTMAPPLGTDGAVSPAASAPGSAQSRPAPVAATPTPKAPPAPVASGASDGAEQVGRLLVRSTPSGASVEVDGVARGVTPVALRDLALGSHQITVSRRGYLTAAQRIVLTKARPSRSLELRLSTAAAPPPSTPATLGRPSAAPASGRSGGPAAATGTLLVESRPPGAAVTIDGRPRGTTPLLIEALAPGDYRVALSLAGYRSFATTVRVVAGERTRAAASLSVQE